MRLLALAALCLACGGAPDVSLTTCITPLGMETDLSCDAVTAHERVVAETTKLDVARLKGWKIKLHPDTRWSEKHGRSYFTTSGDPGWMFWGRADGSSRTLWLADERLHTGVLAHEMCHAMGVGDHADWETQGCNATEREVQQRLTPGSGIFAGPHEGEWFGKDKQLHFGVSAALTLGGHAMLGACTTADCQRLAPWARALIPPVLAFGVGLAKETADHFDYGGFSRRDMAANLAGVLVGQAVFMVGAWVAGNLWR